MLDPFAHHKQHGRIFRNNTKNCTALRLCIFTPFHFRNGGLYLLNSLDFNFWLCGVGWGGGFITYSIYYYGLVAKAFRKRYWICHFLTPITPTFKARLSEKTRFIWTKMLSIHRDNHRQARRKEFEIESARKLAVLAAYSTVVGPVSPSSPHPAKSWKSEIRSIADRLLYIMLAFFRAF